jgi:hypothetical protein
MKQNAIAVGAVEMDRRRSPTEPSPSASKEQTLGLNVLFLSARHNGCP